MRVTLSGTEDIAIETRGSIPEEIARAIVGPGLVPEASHGFATVELLVTSIKDLKPIDQPIPGISIPGMDYKEALWRVGVIFEGQPAWFVKACDIDGTLVRISAKLMIRYPIREARITLGFDSWRATARIDIGGMSLAIDAIAMPDRPEALPPRRALVRDAGAVYEIPWQERAAPTRANAKINLQDGLAEATLGCAVAWSGEAVIHRQRTHRCGLATAVPGQSVRG